MRALLLGCAMATAALHDVWGQVERIDLAMDSALSASQGAAGPSLDTLLSLVDSSDYQEMGFDELGDTAAAKLGVPLPVFEVALKELRMFKRPASSWTLLNGPDRVFYPVLVGSRSRTSLILMRQDSKWRGASYGGATAAQRAQDAIRAAEATLPTKPRRYFWVDVLAPMTGFIGFEDGKQLMLIPVLDDRQHRWQAGVPILADSAFALLAVEARAYNGKPQ
jgi:hypothetical protein